MIRRILASLIVSPLVHAQDTVTYDDDVLPLFQAACLNCHNPDKTKGGLDLSTYAAVLRGGSGGAIIETGNPDSRLIAVVRQTIEPKMPPEGEKLDGGQIGILTRWIEGGLLENKNSKARKPDKPKFASVETNAAGRPEGPPPMPRDLLLDPPVVTETAAAVRALAASPWAPLLAVSSQKQVLLHDIGSLELAGVLPFPEGVPESLAFSPDGRHLIVGGGIPGKSGTTVTFDVVEGTRVLETGREFDTVLAADAAPGFRRMVTGGPSRLLKAWNPETGEAERSVKKHTDWITALDVSPDGVLLASGDRNGGIWVWETDSGNEFHTLRGHQAGITRLVFRSDSNLLASASEDGSIRFWDMNSGNEVRKIDAHPGGVTGFSFARDGRFVSTGRDRKVKLWKADFAHERDLASGLPELPTAAAIDAEGSRAFVADAAGMVRAYHTGDGKPLGEITANPPSIASRLAGFEAAADECGKTLAERETRLAASRQAVESAKTALHEAETRLRQANGIAAASHDAEGHPDAAAKLSEHAAARRAEAEKNVEQRRNDLAAAEKSTAEATKLRDQANRELETHGRQIRKWTAAAINTRRLEAQALAAEHTWQTESLRREFSELAGEVARMADRLARKRGESTSLRHFAASAAPGSAVETEALATMAAIRPALSMREEELARLEHRLAELAEMVDATARQAVSWTVSARRHTEEYQRTAQ